MTQFSSVFFFPYEIDGKRKQKYSACFKSEWGEKCLHKKNIHSQAEIFLCQCCLQLVQFCFAADHFVGLGRGMLNAQRGCGPGPHCGETGAFHHSAGGGGEVLYWCREYTVEIPGGETSVFMVLVKYFTSHL